MSVRNPQVSKPGRRWGRWIGFGVVVVAAAAITVAIQHKGQAAPDKKDDIAAVPLELAPADVAKVEDRALSRSLPLSGTLEPLVSATIKSQITGEVLEVTVREGQVVKKGDVLVRVDPSNLAAQVDSQEATLEKAKADLQLAALNRDNSKVMLEQHFISQNAYDTTVNSYSEAVANVKLAQAQLKLAQISLGYAVIRAPFDGTIAKRAVNPGDKVSPDTPVMAMVDLTQMELQASAPASDIPNVRVGQHSAFRVDGFGDRRFDGVVRRINPTADESSRAIMVYVAVANPDGALKGGMFAQAELTLDRADAIPSIPVAAVHTDAGAPYVFALKDGAIERTTVTLGLSDPQQGFVEVRNGLTHGDRVILAKLDSVKPGTKAVLAGEGGLHAVSAVAANGQGG